MALSTAGKNAMLNQLASVAVYVSVHNVDAPTDNTTEPSGGSPAYARKAITWASASGGSVASSNSPVFDIPASFTVKSVGLWSTSTGGTFYGSADVTDEVFAGQGTYTCTSFTVTLS